MHNTVFLNIISNLINTPIIFLLGLVFFLESFLLLGLLFNSKMYKNTSPKTITIIRGVPGSGKRYLVAQLERDNEEIFSLCDRNEYFIKDKKFNFKGSEIARAEQSSRMKVLKSISSGIRNIYVINYFNEKWMYREYVELAKMYKYKFNILELPCVDNDHLVYFNKRSIYNTPITKSKKCYDNWESDYMCKYYEPYIESLPGDSIPSTNNIDLDKQLDNYISPDYFKKSSESLQKFDTTQSNSLIKYSGFSDVLNLNEFNEIFKREYNNNYQLKPKKIYDLREDHCIRKNSRIKI